MASAATNTFAMTGLIPAFEPWKEAKRINVKLPAGVAYAKGTVLGELVGANETQTLTLATSGTLGGTYTLTFAGAVTSALPFNSSAATVQTAMEGLATIGTNNISVTGSTPSTAGGSLTFTFQNALGKQNVAAIVLGAGSLTADNGSAMSAGTAGSGTNNEVQTIYANSTVTGGTFTITYSGQVTSALDYNATPAVVQAALEALSNLAPGDVTVSGTANVMYILKFGGSLANTDVTAVTIGNGSITGGGSYLVATASAGAAGSNGTYKAWTSSATDGSQVGKALLEYAAATDSSGNITLGGASGGGDKQQTVTTVPAFISGTFRTEDLVQSGAGMITVANVADMGRLIEGTTQQGLLKLS